MTTETNQAEIIDNDYSPLDEPVKQRSYTNHQVNPNQPFQVLEEPSFQPPTFDSFEDVKVEEEQPPRVFNEAYSELDGKEKAMGASMMVEMTLDLYSKGCGFLGKLPEISESKIDKLIAEGELDANTVIPTPEGDLGIKEFAKDYNGTIADAFVVSEEFKDKVRPPLKRVFQKRGVGMTDEQLLAYYFISDLGAKGVQAVLLRKTTNSILDSLREQTMIMRENSQPRPQQQQQQQQRQEPQPQQQTRQQEEYTEDLTEVKVVPLKAEPIIAKTEFEKQVATFSEPEETTFSNLNNNGGFGADYVEPSGMPDFGNEEILSTLESIANGNVQKPVRKSRSATKKPTTRKPRAKK